MVSDRELAHQTQEKFDFYLIGLIFTLLALSIQSADFGNSAVADILELLGWLALLVSGVVGLWRIEYLPVIREKIAIQSELQHTLIELKQMQTKGDTQVYVLDSNTMQDINALIRNRKEAADAVAALIKGMESANFTKYKVLKFSFVFAIVLILSARAYEPVRNLLCNF